MLDFDATNFYPSAIWDETSVFPGKETGFVFKLHKSDIYVEAFNNQTFNQDGNESTILKIKYYIAPGLINQNLLVLENV